MASASSRLIGCPARCRRARSTASVLVRTPYRSMIVRTLSSSISMLVRILAIHEPYTKDVYAWCTVARGLCRRAWFESEQVPGPRPELDIEPVPERIAVAFVGHVVGRVDEPPGLTPHVVPRHLDQPGRGRVAEVDDDQPPALPVPTPRHQVLEAVVAWPAPALAQLPAPVPEGRVGQCPVQRPVERGEVLVGRLVREAAEEHR